MYLYLQELLSYIDGNLKILILLVVLFVAFVWLVVAYIILDLKYRGLLMIMEKTSIKKED
ncbi:MAG: hypothetical protein J6K88_04455 [Oscillospiraceae bacterium]|nr:hypothetical protein [Oscillospiraceae bacterium]